MTVAFPHVGVLRSIASTGLFNLRFVRDALATDTSCKTSSVPLVWRSGCATGVQHHLIPHQPQRPQGGEPPGAAKLSISVFLPRHIPLNPHSILPPITSVYYLSHYAVPVRLFFFSGGGDFGSLKLRERFGLGTTRL